MIDLSYFSLLETELFNYVESNRMINRDCIDVLSKIMMIE